MAYALLTAQRLVGPLLTALAAVLLLATPTLADSIFSARGLGEWVHPTDVRGRGMGGAALAVPDSFNLAPINPALLSQVSRFTLHGEATPEMRRATLRGPSGSQATARPSSTNFPLLRAALRVPRLGVVGVGITQWSDVSYELGDRQAVDGLEFTRRLSGKNGWNAVLLTYARAVRPELRVGVDVSVLVGSFIDIWEVDFDDPTAIDAADSLVVNHSRGPLVRLGALYQPHPRLALGATLTPGTAILLRPERRSLGGRVRGMTSSLDLPIGAGAGVSYQLNRHWLMTAELMWWDWSATALAGPRDDVVTQDVTRVAAGAEYLGGGDSVWGLVPLRAGFYQEPWHYVDAGGKPIVDRFITCGAGLPFAKQAGRLDVSFEWGVRGSLDDHGARERVARLGIGLTLRESVLVGRVE